MRCVLIIQIVLNFYFKNPYKNYSFIYFSVGIGKPIKHRTGYLLRKAHPMRIKQTVTEHIEILFNETRTTVQQTHR